METAATYGRITWDLPSNLGSPAVSSYKLILYEEGDGDTVYNISLSARLPREFNATGLKPGTNYSVTVRAVSQSTPVLVIGNDTKQEFTTNFTGRVGSIIVERTYNCVLVMCFIVNFTIIGFSFSAKC